MDRLKALEIFAAVAERNSFTRAATALDLSTPVVTRAVQELEQDLGLKLLQRSTRHVALTREGEAALARARHVLEAYGGLMRAARQHGAEVAGDIRLGAPASFGAARLAALLGDFMARHPQVRIALQLADAPDPLTDGGIDLALRVAWQLPEQLVARRIGTIAMGVYATPGYLRDRGLPHHPDELAAHDCVVHQGMNHLLTWQFRHAQTRQRTEPALRPAVRANHVEAVLAAALMGQGLALLPRALAEPAVARGELRSVLPGWDCPAPGVFLVYRDRQHQPLRVRKLIEHLAETFEAASGLASGVPGPALAIRPALAAQGAPMLH